MASGHTGVFQGVTATLVTDLGYPVHKSYGNPEPKIPSAMRNEYVMCLGLAWRRSYLSQKGTLRVEVVSLVPVLPPHPDLGTLMRLRFSDRNSYLDWTTQYENWVWKPDSLFSPSNDVWVDSFTCLIKMRITNQNALWYAKRAMAWD